LERSFIGETMIYIVTAMYAEAHPFITRFQLKKDSSHTRFQVFRSDEAGICLIISGTGSVPAAVAVGSLCTKYGPGQGDFLVNVGVCARIAGGGHASRTGDIFLCNKIREQTTGKTFYPDILYRHRFAEAQIITGAKPYKKIEPGETEEADFDLYDMEAAAVYQAGAYYLGPHQMSFLKAVSDDGNTENVNPAQIEGLIGRHMETMADYLAGLQSIAQKERREETFWDDEVQKEWEKLCLDMHCSKVMSESLRQYLRYCILSGIDHASVLEGMYREGKLPCKDKREGKQCFEELKKRLL